MMGVSVILYIQQRTGARTKAACSQLHPSSCIHICVSAHSTSQIMPLNHTILPPAYIDNHADNAHLIF